MTITRQLRRPRLGSIDVITWGAFVALGCILIMVVLGEHLTRYGASATPPGTGRLEGPGWSHLFGTDNFGRDVLDRVVVGARTSIVIGVSVAVLTSILGGLIGVSVALWRGADLVVMRFLDAFMAFPSIFLAIAVVAVFGGGTWQVVVALTIVYFPRTARVLRGVALGIATQSFVEASMMMGGSKLHCLIRHMIPNVWGPVAVQGTYVMARAIVVDASLSFLGLGVPPPAPTWGNILGEAQVYLREAWWLAVLPGLAIAVTTISVNILGDWLRDRLDVRL